MDIISTEELKDIASSPAKTAAKPDSFDHLRNSRRYPFHWKIKLVPELDRIEALEGRTINISQGGATITLRTAYFTTDPVTILIQVPPLHVGESPMVLEIASRMVYSLLSSEHNAFIFGIKFCEFKRGAEAKLNNAISIRKMSSMP